MLMSSFLIFSFYFSPAPFFFTMTALSGRMMIIRGGVTRVLLPAQWDISSPDNETRKKQSSDSVKIYRD